MLAMPHPIGNNSKALMGNIKIYLVFKESNTKVAYKSDCVTFHITRITYNFFRMNLTWKGRFIILIPKAEQIFISEFLNYSFDLDDLDSVVFIGL